MKKTKGTTTTGQMAQTMGMAGSNIIEQAQRVAEKFNPGQVVWFTVDELWDKIEIISYERGWYKAKVLDSNFPNRQRGQIGNFVEKYVQEKIPDAYLQKLITALF